MRVMAYLGRPGDRCSPCGASGCSAASNLDGPRWFLRLAPWAVVAPFLMNTAGWMLTESGRQPWIVQGLHEDGQRRLASVTSTDIWISLAVFVLLYIALAVVDGCLMIRYGGAPEPTLTRDERSATTHGEDDRPRTRVLTRSAPCISAISGS